MLSRAAMSPNLSLVQSKSTVGFDIPTMLAGERTQPGAIGNAYIHSKAPKAMGIEVPEIRQIGTDHRGGSLNGIMSEVSREVFPMRPRVWRTNG